MSSANLSTQDVIRYLINEIAPLKNIVTSSQNRSTRMIALIYANDTPTAPKKLMALVAGPFGDLFLELLIALDRLLVFKLKNTAGGAL